MITLGVWYVALIAGGILTFRTIPPLKSKTGSVLSVRIVAALVRAGIILCYKIIHLENKKQEFL